MFERFDSNIQFIHTLLLDEIVQQTILNLVQLCIWYMINELDESRQSIWVDFGRMNNPNNFII